MVPEYGYTLLQDPDIARFIYREGGGVTINLLKVNQSLDRPGGLQNVEFPRISRQ
jgi:hypothetical protein